MVDSDLISGDMDLPAIWTTSSHDTDSTPYLPTLLMQARLIRLGL